MTGVEKMPQDPAPFTVLHATDLHGQGFAFNWLAKQRDAYDMIAVTGDLCDAFDGKKRHQRIDFLIAWFEMMAEGKASIFWCSGNHEPWANVESALKDSLDVGLRIVGPREKTALFCGVRVRVFGWAERLRIRSFQDRLPELWLHHEPPKGFMDSGGGGHERLAKEMRLNKPLAVLSGHFHEAADEAGDGWTDAGGTIVSNPGPLADLKGRPLFSFCELDVCPRERASSCRWKKIHLY